VIALEGDGSIGQTVRDPALIRNRFMRGLGTGRGSAVVIAPECAHSPNASAPVRREGLGTIARPRRPA